MGNCFFHPYIHVHGVMIILCTYISKVFFSHLGNPHPMDFHEGVEPPDLQAKCKAPCEDFFLGGKSRLFGGFLK